jgi:preprotein translocase subunit Sec61beta
MTTLYVTFAIILLIHIVRSRFGFTRFFRETERLNLDPWYALIVGVFALGYLYTYGS